jgi:hypothetical protein
MPKIKYSSSRGLHQTSGTGIDLATDAAGVSLRRASATVSNVGTNASPSKTLTTADSGGVFFADISTVSIVFQLPTPAAGLNYRIILSTASDNEATVDLVVHTGSDDVDMGGNIMVAGAVVEITSATSVIAIDTSDGAATVGDWLFFECDGTDWYVSGSITTTGSTDIADGYAGHTVP